MKTLFIIVCSVFLIPSDANSFASKNVYLLTQGLQLSTTEDLQGLVDFKVSSQPTLLKKLSQKNGITKVQVIQANGIPSSQIVFVASKWFTNGTRRKAIDPFLIDPNTIVASATPERGAGTCPPDAGQPVPTSEPADPNEIVVVAPKPVEEINPYVKDPCFILMGEKNNFNKKQTEGMHMACFDSIKKKLNINYKDSAYKAISKLYTLPNEQQVFMGRLLTMYGEASGAVPPAEQMAAVLQIIDNRTRVAKKDYPRANQLDVALQNSQFSMYNPNDFNWKRAMFASKEQLKTAMHVIVNRNDYVLKSGMKGKKASNIFHYMASSLCGGEDHPAWAIECKNSVSLSVNKVNLEAQNGHVFFSSVSWGFNPDNRYKTYAKKHLGVK